MINVIDKILELQKPGSVADWWCEAKKNKPTLAHQLYEEEQAYLDYYTSDDVQPVLRIGRGIASETNLTEEERVKAKEFFGSRSPV